MPQSIKLSFDHKHSIIRLFSPSTLSVVLRFPVKFSQHLPISSSQTFLSSSLICHVFHTCPQSPYHILRLLQVAEKSERSSQLPSTVGTQQDSGDGSGGAGDVEGGGEDEGGEENPLQRLIAPLISVFQLIIRSSYIATNIVMMVRFVLPYYCMYTIVLL